MAKVRTFCIYTLLYTEAHFFMYVAYYLITCAEWMASPDKDSYVWHGSRFRTKSTVSILMTLWTGVDVGLCNAVNRTNYVERNNWEAPC